MLWPILKKILTLVSLSILQLSFFAVLPRPFNLVSLPLLFVVAATLNRGLESLIIWTVFLGASLDFGVNGNFGLNTIFLPLIAGALYVFYQKAFTNKSFYSAASLLLVALILARLLFLGSRVLIVVWVGGGWPAIGRALAFDGKTFGWQFLINLACLSVIFWFNYLRRAYFLNRQKKYVGH
jgi:rod shape-determining protein MreD